VVDISHPEFENHVKVVNETLSELGAGDKPVLMVFNKTDSFPLSDDEGNEITDIDEKLRLLEQSHFSNDHETVFISALQNKNMDKLRALIVAMARKEYATLYPYNIQGQNAVKAD
jgi:GTP-binding protein HflX